MTQRLTIALACALSLTALAAGCGDDDGGERSGAVGEISDSSIGKPVFVKRANAICRQGGKELLEEIVAYQQKNLDEFSVKVVSSTARKVIKPKLEEQIEQIGSAGAPEGDAEEIESFFASLLSGVDQIAAKRPSTFEEAELMLRPANQMARSYGIGECAYELVDEAFNRRTLNSG